MHCWLSCLLTCLIRWLILEWHEMCLKTITSSQDLRYLSSGQLLRLMPQLAHILHITTLDLHRHCTSASTQYKVISGALRVCCTSAVTQYKVMSGALRVCCLTLKILNCVSSLLLQNHQSMYPNGLLQSDHTPIHYSFNENMSLRLV